MVISGTMTLKLLCVFFFLVYAGLDLSIFVIRVPSFTIITKGSTLDDVLGGVKIRRYGDREKNQISFVQYEQAQNVLNSTRQLLQAIVDSPDTSPDFNLARVFGVQDYLENSYREYLCYSDDIKKPSLIEGSSGTIRHCFGNDLDRYSSYFVNETYLLTMTGLDEAVIRKLAWDWEGAKLYFIRSTLKIDIPTETVESLFWPWRLFEFLVFVTIVFGLLSATMSTVMMLTDQLEDDDVKLTLQVVLVVTLILKVIFIAGYDLAASRFVSGINSCDSGLIAVSSGFSLLDGSLVAFGVGAILALIVTLRRDA